MDELWGWVVFFLFFGSFLFALFTIFQLVGLVCDWFYRVFVAPRRDAQDSYALFQAWQEEQLRDTPYMAPGRGDPTGPDDDDEFGALVEFWRRT